MKKIFAFISIVAIATAFAASCAKTETSVPETAPKKMITMKCVIGDAPDSKVSIDATGKTAWEVGDEILIYGKWAGGEYSSTVTLKAEDISADGKSATIVFEEFTTGNSGEDGSLSELYAIYPASTAAVDNGANNWRSVHRYNTSNAPLMGGFNNIEDATAGATFYFYNLCGIITFKVSGEFDGYEFEGNDGETVGYSGYQARLRQKADGPDNNYVYAGTPLTVISGPVEPDGSTLNYICIPNGVNLTGGFNLKFYDGVDLIKVAKSVAPLNLPRNGYLALGNITSHLKDYVPPTTPDESDHKSDIPTDAAYDLSVNGTANCYILSEPGTYKFPAVKGNSPDGAGNVFDVALVWETLNGENEVPLNSVIARVDFEDNWIYFETPSPLQTGNALIAAKDSEGKIIWSWHIWIPASSVTNIAEDATFFGSSLMDRNLGAMTPTTTTQDVSTFGMYYQWGRKDPFPGGVTSNSSISLQAVDGPQSTTYAIQNPTHFLKVGESDSAGNWNSADLSNLWDSEKTMYDPCPPGYQVPYYDESYVLWVRNGDDWTFDYTNCYFKYNSATSVFPLAGWLTSSTSPSYVGQRALIWSAKAHSTPRGYCKLIREDKGGYYYHNYFKMEAAPIRCVVE